jgi:hypothetical protein
MLLSNLLKNLNANGPCPDAEGRGFLSFSSLALSVLLFHSVLVMQRDRSLPGEMALWDSHTPE